MNYPRFPALKGRRGYWLRQLSDTSEGTFAGVLTTLTTLGGGDCLCAKVMDGLDFQGANDPTTPIASVNDVIALRDLCAAQKVAFLPVVAPRGLAGEAEVHGAIARVCGCLMADTEPYTGFWDKADPALLPVYAMALRAAAGDAYLIMQPDPRDYGYAGAHVAEAAQYYDGIAGQHYVGANWANWHDVPTEVASFQRLCALGRDPYVTLYGEDVISEALAFWEQVRSVALGVNVFCLGSMNADQLRAFAQTGPPAAAPEPIPGALPPVPVPAPTPMPAMDAEWMLRIGMLELFAGAVTRLGDTATAAPVAIQDAATAAQAVLDVVSKLQPAGQSAEEGRSPGGKTG